MKVVGAACAGDLLSFCTNAARRGVAAWAVTTMNHPRQSRFALLASLTCLTLACGGLLLWTHDGGAALPLAEATPAQANDDGAAGERRDHQRLARTDAAQHVGFYSAAVGSTFEYALKGRFEYSVSHPEGGRQPSGMQVGGAMDVCVADRRDDMILVRVELRDLTLSALIGGGGNDEGGMGNAARKPFHVQLGPDGRVRGYLFGTDLNGQQRNFVRGLFAYYAHTVPADAHGAWQATDVDAAGEFEADFRVVDAHADGQSIERKKQRYTAMAGPELHPHTLSGQSRATFDTAMGWLRAVEVDERTTTKMEELGLEIDLRAVLSIALQKHGEGAPVSVGALWDAAWLPAAGHGEDLTTKDDASERATWTKRLAGQTLVNLIDDLAALLAAAPQDPEAIDRAWQALIWLTKLQPKVAADIQARVNAGMETRLADMLVSALGAAGTEAAQDVLAAMRRDAASTPALRTSATIALFQVAEPSARVLGDLAGDLGRANDLVGDDAMAMLLLGALAPRAADTKIDGRNAFETLLALEGKTVQQDRTDLWLNALANTGTADVLPHAQRYTAHENDRVRAAAYAAARRVDKPAGVALLERGLTDRSADVRVDVVVALGEHRSPAARAALIRAARDDSDATVRRRTLSGLAGFAKKNADARQAIEQMATGDPDADNQKAARTVLDGLR